MSDEPKGHARQIADAIAAGLPDGVKVYVSLPGDPLLEFKADTSRWPEVVITDPDGVETVVSAEPPPADAKTVRVTVQHSPDGIQFTDLTFE